MIKLFGKKKEQPKLADSIAQLREAFDTLDKQEKYREKQVAECLAKARELSKKGDKKGAMFQLKRKKMLEKQIEASFGKKVNIETQIMALQSAAANKDIMEAMKKGKDALASHVNDEQLDKVADLIDDIEEHVNLVDEVDEALSRPVGKMMDDGELEDELAELEEQLVDEDLAEAPLTVPPVKAKAREEESKVGMDLPAAPAASVKKPMSKEEEELAALEAELV